MNSVLLLVTPTLSSASLVTAILFAPIRLEPVVAATIAGDILPSEVGFPKVILLRILVSVLTSLSIRIPRARLRGPGRRNVSGFTEVGENILRLNLALSQCGEIVTYRFFRVKSHLASISADKALVEHTARKLVKVFFL